MDVHFFVFFFYFLHVVVLDGGGDTGEVDLFVQVDSIFLNIEALRYKQKYMAPTAQSRGLRLSKSKPEP